MILVVLPAFNEESAIVPLLKGIHSVLEGRAIEHQLIVVDDGSTDGTRESLEGCRMRLPLSIVAHHRNLGLGSAIRTGLKSALENAGTEDVIVTMDADGTHPPELIPVMAEKIEKEALDIVIASRFRPGAKVVGVPKMRRVTSFGASYLLRLCKPIPGVRDYTSGFRAYRAGVVLEAHDRFGESLFVEDGFACMVDILVKVATLAPKVAEIPIVLRYDQKVGGSKINMLRTIVRTFKIGLSKVQ